MTLLGSYSRFKRAALVLLCAGVLLSLVFSLWPNRALPEGSEPMIAAAKAEARRRGWDYSSVTHVRLINGVWNIELQRYPPSYGGHATVRISQEGTILSFAAGL